MILGTKARYAVMAMLDLAMRQAGAPVPLAAIAERQEIPLGYLEQIFTRLRKQGLVGSVKGPGGGYVLLRPDASMADIVLAGGEPLKMTRCHVAAAGSSGCMKDRAQCLTHDLWEGLGEQIFEYLNAVSLQDLCRAKERRA